MGFSRSADAPFAAVLEPLLGVPSWGVKQGWGSFLTFEFGQPIAEGNGAVHGQWHLWIEMASWRIETAQEVLAACEDDRPVISTAVQQLAGRALTSVAASGPALDTVFDFDGHLVRTFSVYSSHSGAEDNWCLFLPDGDVLAVTTSGAWELHPAKE